MKRHEKGLGGVRKDALRFRWPNLVGMAIGLAGGLALVGLARTSNRPALPSGSILSECDGHLRELVVHYEPSAREIVAPVYRELLAAFDQDITVHVVCSNRAVFDEFKSTFPAPRCQVSPIFVGHPITTWSRDRWVALAPATKGGPTTLWSPRGEGGEDIWPARAGDERVGGDIARALAPGVSARRSQLYFDAGDFLADSENVFVVPRVLGRNLQHTTANRTELLRALEAEFRRPVILLEESPDHHAGMFMASIGSRTLLVGDPALGKKFLREKSPAAAGAGQGVELPGGPDFTPETQHLFDAVAAQCAAAGYRVIRIPLVPARDGRTYLTYVNVLLDRQGNRRLVYLPFYRGVEALNAAARAVWEGLGYEVHPVDCTDTYRHFGSLHCLVNVLGRG